LERASFDSTSQHILALRFHQEGASRVSLLEIDPETLKVQLNPSGSDVSPGYHCTTSASRTYHSNGLIVSKTILTEGENRIIAAPAYEARIIRDGPSAWKYTLRLSTYPYHILTNHDGTVLALGDFEFVEIVWRWEQPKLPLVQLSAWKTARC